MLRIYPLCFFLFCGLLSVQGQDLHFSQWEASIQNLQPAFTGLFSGDYRAMGIYRQQWFSVPVPYATFGAGFDVHLMKNRLEQDVFSFGLQLNHDKAGDAQLSTLNMLASLAYAKRIAPQFFLCAGVQAGWGHRRLHTDKLRFDDQYDGDQFNPALISSDLAAFQQTSFNYADVSAGFGLRYQKAERTWLNVGVALHHLNSPKQSFMGTDQRLALRLNLSAEASFRLNRKTDFLASLAAQNQNVYNQTLGGMGLRYHLDQTLGRETAIFGRLLARQAGSNFDAMVLAMGLNYQTWQFGLSYDITLSPFAVANNRNGAIELSLIYIWRGVPKVGTTKICPVL
jgi:type IX secretion system PorP/SprF family membrane protein